MFVDTGGATLEDQKPASQTENFTTRCVIDSIGERERERIKKQCWQFSDWPNFKRNVPKKGEEPVVGRWRHPPS